MVKEIDIQVQERQRIPNKMDLKSPTPRHIIIEMSKIKDKERILKVARERQVVTQKGNLIKLSAAFSTGTLQARRGCHKVLQVMKSKGLQARLLYKARISFKKEGKIKNFLDINNK